MSIPKNVELALIKLYKINNNRIVLEKLLKHHQGYIKNFTNKTFKTFRGMVNFEDLEQTVIIGFIKGLQNFDVNSGNKLLTYATFWMMSESFDLLCKSTPVHIPANILRQMVWRTDKQYAEALNKMYTLIMNPLQLNRPTDKTISSDIVLKKEEFRHSVDDTVVMFEKHFIPTDVQKAIDKLPHTMNSIFIMKSGLHGKYTTEEIAEILNLDKENIDQIYKKARRLLRKEPALKRLAA